MLTGKIKLKWVALALCLSPIIVFALVLLLRIVSPSILSPAFIMICAIVAPPIWAYLYLNRKRAAFVIGLVGICVTLTITNPLTTNFGVTTAIAVWVLFVGLLMLYSLYDINKMFCGENVLFDDGLNYSQNLERSGAYITKSHELDAREKAVALYNAVKESQIALTKKPNSSDALALLIDAYARCYQVSNDKMLLMRTGVLANYWINKPGKKEDRYYTNILVIYHMVISDLAEELKISKDEVKIRLSSPTPGVMQDAIKDRSEVLQVLLSSSS